MPTNTVCLFKRTHPQQQQQQQRQHPDRQRSWRRAAGLTQAPRPRNANTSSTRPQHITSGTRIQGNRLHSVRNGIRCTRDVALLGRAVTHPSFRDPPAAVRALRSRRGRWPRSRPKQRCRQPMESQESQIPVRMGREGTRSKS